MSRTRAKANREAKAQRTARTVDALLPIAVRAYAVPQTATSSKTGGTHDSRSHQTRPTQPTIPGEGLVLVFDCETTTDPSQRLLFGS
jgi:hypothetical protein